MKTKILLSSVLIAILPLVANAGNRVGPDPDESGHPVVADAEGPYQTAEITTADQAQVVSASYVKGAYNDTIAAINLLDEQLGSKQKFIMNVVNGAQMGEYALGASSFVGGLVANNLVSAETDFVSAAAVAAGIKSQRVTAVDTWGSPHTVDVAFKTVQ